MGQACKAGACRASSVGGMLPVACRPCGCRWSVAPGFCASPKRLPWPAGASTKTWWCATCTCSAARWVRQAAPRRRQRLPCTLQGLGTRPQVILLGQKRTMWSWSLRATLQDWSRSRPQSTLQRHRSLLGNQRRRQRRMLRTPGLSSSLTPLRNRNLLPLQRRRSLRGDNCCGRPRACACSGWRATARGRDWCL